MSKYTICKAREEAQHIIFKLRLEDGTTRMQTIPFRAYFYMREEHYDIVSYQIKTYVDDTEMVTDRYNDSYVKIFLNDNNRRNYVKKIIESKNIPTYEADINAIKRFLIDNIDEDLHQESLRYVDIDIETYDMHPLEKDLRGGVIPRHPILSIATKCKKTANIWFARNEGLDTPRFETYKENYLTYVKLRAKQESNKDVVLLQSLKDMKDKLMALEPIIIAALEKGEKILLEKYAEHIKDFDVSFAWNGNRFDFEYLKKRYEFHQMNYDDLWIVNSDAMEIFKKNNYDSITKYSLDFVGKHVFKKELEEGATIDIRECSKIDWKTNTNAKKYYELFLLYPKLLKEYNIQDVNVMHLIEKRFNFLKTHEVQTRLCHCLFNDTVFNSHMCDYLFLNEYKKHNIIKNSRPPRHEIERRKDPLDGDFPPGGYTFADIKGLFHTLLCKDFKSQYPTTGITYNISPDTYVTKMMPNLSLVFKPNDVIFIKKVCLLSKEFLNHKGELKKKTYEKAINDLRLEMGITKSMKELMFEFTDKYVNSQLTEYLKENKYTATPADINYDTRGWKIHPHFIFDTREEGIFPKISKKLILTRDKVKYSLKGLDNSSPEYKEKKFFEIAIKTLGNSLYGFLGFKPGREFMVEIPTAITSASRYHTKKCILFAMTKGYECPNGDTDSIYMKNIKGLYTIDDMEAMYHEYFKEMVKPYNTQCEIKLNNPRTKEIEVCNHFIVFEYEKTFDACIVVAKKRYYFKYKDGDDFKYGTQGGAYKKSDTIAIAATMQKELTKDILDENFDKELWKIKLLELKEKTFNNKLDVDVLINRKGLSRNISEYGKPTIDGKTGEQKRRKDGKLMFAPIPPQVKLAKRLIEEGHNIEVGDKIEYIVKSEGPIEAISVDEYLAGEKYDTKYYWTRICTPIIEILSVCYPEETFTFFADCWYYTPKQLKKLIEKLYKDLETEGEE